MSRKTQCSQLIREEAGLLANVSTGHRSTRKRVGGTAGHSGAAQTCWGHPLPRALSLLPPGTFHCQAAGSQGSSLQGSPPQLALAPFKVRPARPQPLPWPPACGHSFSPQAQLGLASRPSSSSLHSTIPTSVTAPTFFGTHLQVLLVLLSPPSPTQPGMEGPMLVGAPVASGPWLRPHRAKRPFLASHPPTQKLRMAAR